jgi:dUTP pyrophosphatase
VAQMVIAPVIQVAVEEVAELSSSKRGDGGFGHTG